jgi:hypothetical protein
MNDVSMITTQSDLERYKNFGQNMTTNNMTQATIYHVRKFGENIHDPEEREKYYNDDFLNNVRHVNDRVEEELEEFKVEIEDKVQENSTKFFTFPRPCGNKIQLNTSQNLIDPANFAD